MKNNYRKIILPALVVSSLMLTGCGKKKDCPIPTSHVHKYTKKITNNIEINKYMNKEYESYYGYQWNNDYIEITKEDESFYNSTSNLFKASDNFNYLYNLMKYNKDFLEYYYSYNTIETYTVIDSNGHTKIKTRTVNHSGWCDDSSYNHNTGKVRLGHYKYYAYYVEKDNNRYKEISSPLVDDIRQVLDNYPYVEEECYRVVYEYYKFRKNELPYLRVDQFNVFDHPDLSNTSINYNEHKVLKK